MRARLAAAWVSSVAIAAAALAAAACRLTSGLTGGEVPDAAGEGGLDGACDADLATSTASCGACGNACPVGLNSFAGCVDGGCVLQCASGFADCDDAGANGCETNIFNGPSSKTNCGRCGHDCMGNPLAASICQGGFCQPFPMSNGVNTPVQIVADETHLYGINATGRITRVAKDAGQSQLVDIVQGDSSPQSPPPRIALSGDGGTLYYTTLGDAGPDASAIGTVSFVSAGASGLAKGTVLATTPDPFAIDVSATHLYWSEGNPENVTTCAIRRCKLGSCTSPYETVVPPSPGRIFSLRVGAVQGQAQVFWTNAGTPPNELDSAVYHCNQGTNCSVQAYTDSSKSPLGPFALTTDNRNVYFTTLSSDVASCDLQGCAGIATVLDQNQFKPLFLQVDQANLFWTNGDGTIKSIPRIPGAGALPGAGERILYQSRTASPWDIVVDPDAIYWTDLDGLGGNPTLYRLAR